MFCCRRVLNSPYTILYSVSLDRVFGHRHRCRIKYIYRDGLFRFPAFRPFFFFFLGTVIYTCTFSVATIPAECYQSLVFFIFLFAEHVNNKSICTPTIFFQHILPSSLYYYIGSRFIL